MGDDKFYGFDTKMDALVCNVLKSIQALRRVSEGSFPGGQRVGKKIINVESFICYLTILCSKKFLGTFLCGSSS